jgi:two-component sensor histidine kinase
MIVPDERLAEFEAQRRTILAGETIRTETTRRKKNGEIVPVSLNAAPVRAADGRIIAISSIIHDITDRKAAEDHKHFLMRELAHRSKNQLAIIQSIAGQTARRAASIDDFLTRFRQRLQGLAASHDLLTKQDWKGAALEELVRQQIGVVADARGANVNFEGPHVLLDTAAAEAIGLALHELATNSVKYGALSVDTGRVTVSWKVLETGGRRLRLEWKESGGPTVQQPAYKGFGSQMIETMVARSLDGQAAIEYRPEGIHWHVEFAT